MSIAEQIAQVVAHMPLEQQEAVWAFVTSLEAASKKPSPFAVIGSMAEAADALDDAVAFAMHARAQTPFRASEP